MSVARVTVCGSLSSTLTEDSCRARAGQSLESLLDNNLEMLADTFARVRSIGLPVCCFWQTLLSQKVLPRCLAACCCRSSTCWRPWQPSPAVCAQLWPGDPHGVCMGMQLSACHLSRASDSQLVEQAARMALEGGCRADLGATPPLPERAMLEAVPAAAGACALCYQVRSGLGSPDWQARRSNLARPQADGIAQAHATGKHVLHMAV